MDEVCETHGLAIAAHPSNVADLALAQLEEGRLAMEVRLAGLEAVTPTEEFAAEAEAWLVVERERTQMMVEMADAGSAEAADAWISERADSGEMEDLNNRSLMASVVIANAAGTDWYGC